MNKPTMDFTFFCAYMLAVLITGAVVWSTLTERRENDDYAYVIGSGVQWTGEGALIYCKGEPVYLYPRHEPGVGEYVRSYVERACS